MKVEIIHWCDRNSTDYRDYRDGININIDGKQVAEYFNEWVYDCPEDVTLYRELSFIEDIFKWLIQAHNDEELVIEHKYMY